MERIFTLIDKLSQQKAQGASPSHLLFTVQLLQQELSGLQKKENNPSTRKVAVTLPFTTAVTFNGSGLSMPAPEQWTPPVVAEEKEIFYLDTPEEELIEETTPVSIAPMPEGKPEPQSYSLPKPVVPETFFEETKPVVKEEPRPSYVAQQLFNSAFETTVEVPTLVPYKTTADVHERISGEKKESLNDRLKQEKPELGSLLKETPIKDLRKGIGINDRFTFVRELFRGDDAAYERSIKTINNFGIYTEAEYWMSRELKLKLGWDENNETVQHFYQLIKRRFS